MEVFVKELWKAVSRDLIMENAFGREEATRYADEAYSCLLTHTD
jgi:hypothetical protein